MTSDSASATDSRSEFETATHVLRGTKARVPTTQLNIFRLAIDYMTIAFMFDSTSQHANEYPRYLLESEDGTYRRQLCPKNDLKKPNDYYELRFDGLLPGKRYRLTRFLDSDYKIVLFDRADFSSIVDQQRDAQAVVANHDYGDYAVDMSCILELET